jgi:hypothetical protein
MTAIAIRNKTTNALFSTKVGKTTWKTVGQAKSAFHTATQTYYRDQTEYELVALIDPTELKEAVESMRGVDIPQDELIDLVHKWIICAESDISIK